MAKVLAAEPSLQGHSEEAQRLVFDALFVTDAEKAVAWSDSKPTYKCRADTMQSADDQMIAIISVRSDPGADRGAVL